MLNSNIEELFKNFGVGPDANGAQNLTPQITSKIITEIARIRPVLRNAIPQVAWPTRVYDWRSRTSVGYAQTVSDLASISVTDEKFSDNQASMSIYTILSLLSRFAISVDQPLIDVKKLFVLGMTNAMVRLEGKYIIQGDPNNSGNSGIITQLNAGYTAGQFASGTTANFAMFAAMNNYQKRNGYDQGPRAYVVSPGVFACLASAAYNKVRFLGEAQNGQYGFPMVDGTLTIQGIPVFEDPYLAVQKQVTNETLTGSSTTYTFAQKFPIVAAYDDQASASFTAPVLSETGSNNFINPSAYSISVDPTGLGTVTFTTAPSAAPTATYWYEQQNVLLLSLDPSNLVRAVNQDLQIDQDLASPYTQLATPVRMSMFATLAVRNTAAHLLAQNVVVPTGANF